MWYFLLSLYLRQRPVTYHRTWITLPLILMMSILPLGQLIHFNRSCIVLDGNQQFVDTCFSCPLPQSHGRIFPRVSSSAWWTTSAVPDPQAFEPSGISLMHSNIPRKFLLFSRIFSQIRLNIMSVHVIFIYDWTHNYLLSFRTEPRSAVMSTQLLQVYLLYTRLVTCCLTSSQGTVLYLLPHH